MVFTSGGIALAGQSDCINYEGIYKSEVKYYLVISQPSCDEVEIKYLKSLSDSEPDYDHIYKRSGNMEVLNDDSIHGLYIWTILSDSLVFIDSETYNKNDPSNKVNLISTGVLRKHPDGSIEESYLFIDSRVLTPATLVKIKYKKLN